jgi:hypothetical protein
MIDFSFKSKAVCNVIVLANMAKCLQGSNVRFWDNGGHRSHVPVIIVLVGGEKLL